MIDSIQNALKELYISLGGDASAVRNESDVNDLIRAIAGLKIGPAIESAEELPTAPESTGEYALHVTIAEETAPAYSWDEVEKELQTAPTESGTYTLQVTVADGTATYSWAAVTT